MPKFSIIIPVYNVAPYLRECLDSVLAQTFTDWEAICVDDGSTDDSGDILDSYARRDKRFAVHHTENQGVAAARQVALDMARGGWVVGVDPDDWIEPEFLAEIITGLSVESVDMLCCDFFRNVQDEQFRVSLSGGMTPSEHMRNLLSGVKMGSLFAHVISRTFIVSHGITFPPRGCDVAEDLAFLCSILKCGPRMRWHGVCRYHYRIRPGSLSNSPLILKYATRYSRSIEWLRQLLAASEYEHDVYQCAGRLKRLVYDDETIDDAFFDQFIPWCRSLDASQTPFWHRALFWLAIHGQRRRVLAFLRIVRLVRGKVRK